MRRSRFDSDSEDVPYTTPPEIVANEEGNIDFKSNMDTAMANFLELQEVLSEVGLDEELDVPSIVVLGDQSVGKSTVLEMVSGIPLPKGTNIVTRCPIRMSMRNEKASRIDISYKSLSGEEKRYDSVNPSEVEELLRKAQEKSIAKGQNISTNEITLKIYGPSVPNMIIVDLPGLNYSEKGLAKDIKNLIQKYIQRPSTVIVLVHASTGDISSTETTQLARNVDPNLERTMCVLTKPDLLTENTTQNDLVYLARNKHDAIKFKQFGFVVVRGKGSDSSDQLIPIVEAREREREFFASHPTYRELVKLGRAGTDNLIKVVSDIVYNNALKSLPKLIADVRRMYNDAKQEKKNYPVVFEDESSKTREIASIIYKVNNDFDCFAREDMDSDVRKEFHVSCSTRDEYDEFARRVFDCLKPSEELYGEVREDVIKHRGPEPRGFPRYSIYQNRVQRKMREIQDLALDCFFKVETIVGSCLSAIIGSHARYSLLKPLTDVNNVVFEERKDACKQFIETLFKMEISPYIQDYNLENVPLFLTKDKLKFELLPSMLSELRMTRDAGQKKAGFADLMRSMSEMLGVINPILPPLATTVITSAETVIGVDSDEEIRGEENLQTETQEKASGGVGEPHTLPGAPPTEFPYAREPIQVYVDSEVQIILTSYYRYMYHTGCNLLDTIPKCITHHLITSLKEALHIELLNRQQELKACMQEDEIVAARRTEINGNIAKFERVLDKCSAFELNLHRH